MHAVAFLVLFGAVAGPQDIFRAWPLTFGTVPSFVALPPAGHSVPTLFSVLLPWHIAPFLSSPRGQGTKQELPSDLALPIFSLMQKASVWDPLLGVLKHNVVSSKYMGQAIQVEKTA